MSQHTFSTTYRGRPTNVLMGWDRPLAQFFLVVEIDFLKDEYLYSNLNDPNSSAAGIDYFCKKLERLGINIPQNMINEIMQDQICNRGNRTCVYQSDGSFTDSNFKGA